MAQFRRGLDIAEGLVKADPKNYDHLRFAIGFKDGIGRVLLAQGQAAQALAMFRANSSPFLLSDAGNGLWQGYAAIGHERIADALLAQAELGEAGDEYRKELAILAPLVASNPTIERKIFLAGAHFKLGEVLQRQALLPDATEHFNQSLAITEPLGSANPEFIGYQVFMQQTRLRISQANDRPGEAETTLGFTTCKR